MGLTHRIKNDTVEIETTHTPDVDQWSYVTAQVDRLSEEIKIFKNGYLSILRVSFPVRLPSNWRELVDRHGESFLCHR